MFSDVGSSLSALTLRPWALGVVFGAAVLLLPAIGSAQNEDVIGLPVVDMRVEQEGRLVNDPLIVSLISTRVGQPLSMRDVRETIEHLNGLGRFEDTPVTYERTATGVRLTYTLIPRHPIQSVEFRGSLGLSEQELRQTMTAQFGALPSATRVNDVARALANLYRERGYLRAKVESRVQQLHDPDRGIVTFTIDAGTRAPIKSLTVEGLEGADRLGLENELEARAGRPYDRVALQSRLDRYVSDLRARGYYEARGTIQQEFTPEGAAVVDVSVERGPHVTIAFAGDARPSDVRDELVPLRREGSIDEDLLEDAERGIEDYLKARGYSDADVRHTREQKGNELVITITVNRGTRHILDDVEIRGNGGVPTPELRKLMQAKEGEPFVQQTIDRGAAAITQTYRARGFTRVKVDPVVAVLPRSDGSTGAGDRRVLATVNVTEGPKTLVGSIVIQGNAVLSDGQIRSLMTSMPERPYSEVDIARDRDRVQLEYLNLGYESAMVTPHVTFADNDSRADVRFEISEGPQILVDHIIIVGNRRTSTETIQRALLLKPGQPLGYAARTESQQRLAALGLFRRFRISDLRHGSEPRRDILVEIEEAPPTTLGYGGGLEGGVRLRPTGVGEVAEERFDVAPRGFIEIGRRNLFGKNRSINLFTRVALKTRDAKSGDQPRQTNYGFNEYRVLLSYREPRVFDTGADVLVTGTLDQAIRSSFNFRSRELRGQAALRLARHYGIAGRYSFEQNELFDEAFKPEEAPLIDRLFPQVRLSKLSLSVFRDTRNDPIDPDTGWFMSADNDLALRGIGSEVGFVKTYLQASTFKRLPVDRRMVVRLRGVLGVAQGFAREVEQVDTNGNPIVGPDGQPLTDLVDDLPASERFFAGGDTTVRGFSLDRLGTERTITPSGFPTGGNGVVILNGELLVNAWRSLDVVGFLDGGNVFPRVNDIDLGEIRPAAGFGVRYRSPVGPVRIDLGFNLDPRELVPGTLERRRVLHVSLGQAF